MPYTPLNWQDGEQGGTPISAANLNRMEQGIADAHDMTDALAPLEPHVADLLDIRIVDHNLDAVNPPRGYYIRYANGRQECFGAAPIPQKTSFETTEIQGLNFLTFFVSWIPPVAMTAIHYMNVSLGGDMNYEAEVGDVRSYKGPITVTYYEGAGLIAAEISLLRPTPFNNVIYSTPAYWHVIGSWEEG